MKHNYIKSHSEFQSYLQGFEDKRYSVIALDIEAESNLHAYGEKLCLIQIFDGTNKVLIDPLEMDSNILKAFFENRNILKIVYDASSDLSLLKNTHNIDMKSILDLRPAVEILDYEKKDLHSVIAVELGVTLTKKSKFQRHNWVKRPIDKEAIAYALNDVIYLYRLKDAIFKKLYARNLLDLYILKNLQVQQRDYTRDPQDRYRRLKGYSSLSNVEKRAFRRVFDIRERYAKRINMPSHNVISRADLISIAKDAGSINEIRFPRRFTAGLIQEIVRELEKAVGG